MTFPLPNVEPAEVGLNPRRLERLCEVIEKHIASGMHPGAQIAVARHGKLALFRSFGLAKLVPEPVSTTADTLFLTYSNTKVVTAALLWMLVEDGLLRFDDRVADYLPGFEKHRKGDIQIFHLLTHQAGFPNAPIPLALATDHAALLAHLCEIKPEWVAGSRVHYHSASAHWVAAMVIEAITGQDYRNVIRDRVLAPLGLADEMVLEVKGDVVARCADMHGADGKGCMAPLLEENSAAYRAAGRPGGGIHATARGMAAFYQMLVRGGELAGERLLSPRMIAYAMRNFTGERLDMLNGQAPHRALGPSIRGTTDFHRGHGALAHPLTFGHGGAGSSYCWGDPDSGVSFAFLSNAKLEDDVHDPRMELLSNIAHAAIIS